MQNFLGFLLYLVPKKVLSYWVGCLVHLRLPKPLSTWSVRVFANYYNINMDEAERDLEAYKSIGELFTRKLKPGVRPIEGDSFAVHPCDALITTSGAIEDSMLVQAKGKNYFLDEFLQDSSMADQMRGGSYFTYYLCPTDYHRVHSPVEGKVTKLRWVPGHLWPVNQWSVKNIKDLFAINERVVAEIQTSKGPVVVVMVGATNVGKMTLSFEKRIVTNQFQADQSLKNIDYPEHEQPELRKGQEFGTFHMGSTVIVLYPKGIQTPIDFDKVARVGQRFIQ